MPRIHDAPQATANARRARAVAPFSIRDFGPWQIVELLGGGRCTEVFAARPLRSIAAGVAHGMSSAPYAIKALRAEWESDLSARARLAREADVAREVVHTHLVPVLSAHLSSAPFCLVMPRLPGQTLEKEIARTSCPPGLALCFVRQVAQALAALHAAGWAHGDIKPANVMVSPEGHVTLIDLEFAYRPREVCVWDQPATFGTALYLAPELITSAYAPDIRSDIYSLGVTLYELLCGKRPFDASTPAELLRQHKEARPQDPRVLCAQLPTEVAQLVRRMLAKEPFRRPQTPAELVRELVGLEIQAM